MTNYDLLLFDINALGYTSMYVPQLAALSHNGHKVAALHGAPTTAMNVVDAHPGALPVLLWDGRADWRVELCPTYKGDRGDTPEKLAIRADYKIQAKWLEQLFLAAGWPQLKCDIAEADDLGGQIIRSLPDLNILMVTKDTDWWQSISAKAHWYNPYSKIYLDDVCLGTDLPKDGPFESADEYILAKALAGDTSDKIPGLDRVGIKTACKVLRKYGSLQAIIAAVKNGEAKKDNLAQKVAANLKLIERNQQIMDWRNAPEVRDDESLNKTWGPSDAPRLDELTQQFGLCSVGAKLRTQTFRSQAHQAIWQQVCNVFV